MDDRIILWEAHRGGGGFELPESTPMGFEYAWMLGGTPEADVNATADGILLSLHDGKLERTGRNVPPEIGRTPISALSSGTVRRYDIGSDAYPDQVVPSIGELLEKLRADSRKEIIIDYKSAPLDKLAWEIARRGVGRQVTLATTDEEVAAEFKRLAPEVRIKIWLGGSPEEIMRRFDALAARNFGGFEQLQLHLNEDGARRFNWRYQLPPAEVKRALETTRAAGVLLQVLPWQFERADLFAILDLGVRSFAVDYPNKFCLLAAEYFAVRTWAKPGEGIQTQSEPA